MHDFAHFCVSADKENFKNQGMFILIDQSSTSFSKYLTGF